MLTLTTEQLAAMVSDVWSLLFAFPIIVNDEQPVVPDANYSGSITITGAWDGSVCVKTSEKHARVLASIIFGNDPDNISETEILDIVGEITNMVGGQVKAMVQGECQLSLPCVNRGDETQLLTTKNEIIQALSFQSEQEPVTVTVFMTVQS